MIKKRISIALLLIAGLMTSAQTEQEKNDIRKTYDLEAISKLQKRVTAFSTERTKRVTEYVKTHGIETFYRSNGNKYVLDDIIDNKPVYITTTNVSSAKATRTNFLHNNGGLGLDLEGQNMTIGVWEIEHALTTHVEFDDYAFPPTSRLTSPDFEEGVSEIDNHSTHVSGTIIGKGNDPRAKGMAPRASAVAYDAPDVFNEVITEIIDNALLISNHSYGVPVSVNGEQNAPTWMMGNYDSQSRTWDGIAYDFPYYLYVASAGNSGFDSYTGGRAAGYDKLTREKNAKNNLIVANANNPVTDANGDLISANINGSSSQGPSDDGRIKPDIAGAGTGIFSSVGTGIQAYANLTGTSMSSPNVAGSLLLLQQYYNELNSQFMRASTLKGLACHTADDDSERVGPDPIFGWGLLNVKRAAEVIQDNTTNDAVISELTLLNGDTYSSSFSTSGNEPIAVTICWTDPPGTSQSGINNSNVAAIVNDLDVRLIAPDGSISRPWKLQTSNVNALAIKGINNVDTVEKIDVPNPLAGTYTIEVSHKFTLTDDLQAFSLIVTADNLTLTDGDTNVINGLAVYPNPNEGRFSVSFESYTNNEDVKITLTDLSGRLVYNNIFVNKALRFNESINLSNVQSGIYILNINQGSSYISKKLIIN